MLLSTDKGTHENVPKPLPPFAVGGDAFFGFVPKIRKVTEVGHDVIVDSLQPHQPLVVARLGKHLFAANTPSSLGKPETQA